MKCQRCNNPATFHITELTGDEPQEVHLCEECAREYLAPSKEEMAEVVPALAGMLAEQLAIGQTAEELARLDQRACPICGITFLEFRKQGRLGCPNDYLCFEKELEPLLLNIHGETKHIGKVPQRCPADGKTQIRLIRLRREMKEAVMMENYERASELRDEIRIIEAELRVSQDQSTKRD
ncbi:MAG: UvrB/UvrC motif-containing protein [Pirellulales bacterium]|nr:UvrB/UvrC motif-containing protein [Pirellulales bacterium]